jgi:hypothetical protein
VITFLFWNIKKKSLTNRVRNLVRAHSVDLVILSECQLPSPAVACALGESDRGPFNLVPGSGSELHLYTRLPISRWHALYADPLEAWLTFRVQIGRRPAILLFIAHLPSKLRASDMDQVLVANQLAANVRATEAQQGHERSLVVGDLNANPFENSLVWAGGLHSVMSRDVITRSAGERTVRGAEYPLFYNPMWGAFGDRTPGPPGTYYRSPSGSVNYFWNTYDQVLLRAALIPYLREVIVGDTDGADSLLTANGLPDTRNGSDHLPLVFKLDW